MKVQKPLKQRISAVCQADFAKFFVCYFRFRLTLLHDGRQLFVVADEDEFRHLTKQTNQLRFKDLRRFIDDEQRKVFQREKRHLRLQRSSGSNDDSNFIQSLANRAELRLVADGLLQQPMTETWVARISPSDAHIVQFGGFEHIADFIDGTVGVGGEENRGWVLGVG